MFRTLLLLVLAALVLNAAAAVDQPVRPTPMVRSLAPTPAKAGDEIIATGQYLGKDAVGAVYFTAGDNTFEAKILSQTQDTIKLKIPADMKPGKFGLMVLVKGDVPRFIDEPVFVTIE
jgi:opacity protein-like surface antigen